MSPLKDFDSCRATLGRAEEHVETVERQIRTWFDHRPYRFVRHANPEFTRHSLTISITKPPALLQWSLIASDAVHNMRCALDHLVYGLAIRRFKVDPPPDAERLAFPICDSPESFREAKGCIHTLSDPVQTAVERLQPYHRSHPYLPPLLRLGRTLDNANKHRLVQLAVAQQAGGEFRHISYRIEPGETIGAHVHTAEVADGTEIASITVNRPTPEMDYDFTADIIVTLHHAPGPRGHDRSNVILLLRELLTEVTHVVTSVTEAAAQEDV